MMRDSQIDLAISYYNLYANLPPAITEAQRKDDVVIPSTVKTSSDNDNHTNNAAVNEKVLVIEDDVWTAQDEEEAAALLAKTLDRCRIHPSTAAARDLPRETRGEVILARRVSVDLQSR